MKRRSKKESRAKQIRKNRSGNMNMERFEKIRDGNYENAGWLRSTLKTVAGVRALDSGFPEGSGLTSKGIYYLVMVCNISTRLRKPGEAPQKP